MHHDVGKKKKTKPGKKKVTAEQNSLETSLKNVFENYL